MEKGCKKEITQGPRHHKLPLKTNGNECYLKGDLRKN